MGIVSQVKNRDRVGHSRQWKQFEPRMGWTDSRTCLIAWKVNHSGIRRIAVRRTLWRKRRLEAGWQMFSSEKSHWPISGSSLDTGAVMKTYIRMWIYISKFIYKCITYSVISMCLLFGYHFEIFLRKSFEKFRATVYLNPVPKRLSLTLSSRYFMSQFEWPDFGLSH